MNLMDAARGIAVILVIVMLILMAAPAAARSARKREETAPAAYVPALIRSLRHDDWTVRRDAACALGKIGPAAKAAMPNLCCATGDPVDAVRRAAAEAMARIDPGQP